MKNMLRTTLMIASFIAIGMSTSIGQSKNAFYVELGGNGLFFSANYDFRFSDATSWGARIGAGYIGSVEGDGGVANFPIMVNNLLGKDGKYFEVGAGVTILTAGGDFLDDDVSEVIGTLSFKYRRQPVDGGFMWHIGITPIIADGVFVPYWFGIGIGYSW